MKLELEIPDDFSHVYLTSYPEGHPNGPWEADMFARDRMWYRGRGNTPQEALSRMTPRGAPTKVTGGLAPRPKIETVNIAGLDLDL